MLQKKPSNPSRQIYPPGFLDSAEGQAWNLLRESGALMSPWQLGQAVRVSDGNQKRIVTMNLAICGLVHYTEDGVSALPFSPWAVTEFARLSETREIRAPWLVAWVGPKTERPIDLCALSWLEKSVYRALVHGDGTFRSGDIGVYRSGVALALAGLEVARLIRRVVLDGRRVILLMPFSKEIDEMSDEEYHIYLASAAGEAETKIRARITSQGGEEQRLWDVYSTIAKKKFDTVPESKIKGLRAARALLVSNDFRTVGAYLVFWLNNLDHFSELERNLTSYGPTLTTFQQKYAAIVEGTRTVRASRRKGDRWFKNELDYLGLPEDLLD